MMRIRIFTAPALAVVFMMISVAGFARERQEFYNGIRGLGMGDASVATVNDETAMLINPAALGRLRDFYGTILDPELEIGAKSLDIQRADAFSQPTKIDDVVPSMITSAGTYYRARTNLFPSFVAKNFGLGLLISSTLAGVATGSTNVDLFYRNDMALLLGYNLRLWDGRIKIGFTGKVVSRIELNEANFNPAAQNLDEPTLASAGLLKEGTGVGGDVGLLLTAPWTYLPTLGVAVHDVGNTAYTNTLYSRLSSATTKPDISKQDADVAISVSPIHQNNLRSVWTIQYNSLLTASSETDKAKLIHFGTEFNFGDVFFLRAGYNQRYWTAGAELSSERFQFQMATYGEEVGTSTATVEDRRYVLKFAFRF